MRRKWTILGVALVLLSGSLMAGKGGKGPGGGGGGGGEDPPPPADPVIAYAQLERSGWAVKVMNADGSNQAVLVADTGDSFADPSWSPDGSKIVFGATDRLDGTGIYVVPADGSASPQKLVTTLKGGIRNPMWSPVPAPDGYEKIAFQDNVPNTRGQIWIVNSDGSGLTNLTASKPGSHMYPAWSSDADQIAVARRLRVDGITRYDLIVYDLGLDENGMVTITGESNLTDIAGSPLQPLADDRNVAWQRYHAAWARGGDTIVVSVYEVIDGKDNIDLWAIDPADPAHPVRLTNTTASAGPSYTVQERHADFSPDDLELVFRMRAGRKDSGIYVLNSDGTGTPHRLVKSEDVRAPSWSR